MIKGNSAMKYRTKEELTPSASIHQSGCLLLVIAGMTLSAQAIPMRISGDMTTGSTSFRPATEFTVFENGFVGGPSAVSGDSSGTRGAATTPPSRLVSGGNPQSFDARGQRANSASDNGRPHSGRDTVVSVPDTGSTLAMLGAGCLVLCMMGRKLIVRTFN